MATVRPLNEEIEDTYDFTYKQGVQTVSAKNGFGVQGARITNEKQRDFPANTNRPVDTRGRVTNTTPTNYRNTVPVPPPKKVRRVQNPKRFILKKKPSVVRKSFSRVKVVAVTGESLIWAVPTWLFVQLPFAIISLLSFGAIGALDAHPILDKLSAIIGYVFTILGLPPVTFTSLFFISLIVTLVTGLFTLLIIGLQYKLALLHPLFGNGAALKFGAVLLALVGYLIPGLNFIPWGIFWIAAVFFYPK